MKLVVVTMPTPVESECELIELLLREGVDCVHYRKPEMPAKAMQAGLERIAPSLRSRLTLHDNFELAGMVGGIHLNSRNRDVPQGFGGRISTSCHSLDELRLIADNYDYAFLSPIFDSVSKQGYKSAFTIESLRAGAAQGLIGKRTYALGGVGCDNINIIKQIGFGGVAVLGNVWQYSSDRATFVSHIRKLLAMMK